MELMSSAFLCVLVALLPQTLVTARNKHPLTIDTKSNNSVISRLKPTLRKALLLNINGPPLVSNISELQSVFNDFACKSCNKCMHRAIKAHSMYVRMSNNRPSAEELREDVFSNEIDSYLHSTRNKIKLRSKRDVKPTATTVDVKPKKIKTKKNRLHKAVTVTKYDIDGEVYALKVKEAQTLTDPQNDVKSAGTCQVYSVKKSFPCESPEGEGLLLAARRKANRKKTRKEQDKKGTSIMDTQTTTTHTSAFKKREVDNSQVPENFMPSIEDFF